jgi:hypothetical protein
MNHICDYRHIFLNIPTDDRHFSYLFVWKIATLSYIIFLIPKKKHWRTQGHRQTDRQTEGHPLTSKLTSDNNRW